MTSMQYINHITTNITEHWCFKIFSCQNFSLGSVHIRSNDCQFLNQAFHACKISVTLAYSIKSSMWRTFVNSSSSPQLGPHVEHEASLGFLFHNVFHASIEWQWAWKVSFFYRVWLDFFFPCTNRTWSWYNETINFKCACGTPCTLKPSNNPLDSIRSRPFRRPKLAHQIGTDHSTDFEHTLSKTAKTSSNPTEERNGIWALDWWASNIGFTRS